MAEAGTIQSLIAPRRYIQGRGVLGSLGKHVAELGSQPLVIADENVWKLAGDRLSSSFQDAGVEFRREVFGGVCSHRELDRITEVAKGASTDAPSRPWPAGCPPWPGWPWPSSPGTP